MKIGILKGFIPHYKHYIDACKEMDIDYSVVDIESDNWIHNIKNHMDCNGFIAHPPSHTQEYKSIYDERTFFINKILKKPIYPSWENLYIYESKRNMASFLKFHNLPHNDTKVFVKRKEALAYINKCDYPIVFKTNSGAGGKGIQIVKSKRKARRIINKTFSRFHYKLALGNVLFDKSNKLPLLGISQKHNVIIQEYKPIKWEWRIIKVGNIYAGHKKLLKDGKASGSGLVGWDVPPMHLFELADTVADKGNFSTISVDIFETESGEFIINEIQAIFGSKFHIQMKKNSIPGYFEKIDGEFVFKEGEIHQNSSTNLRIRDFVNQLTN